ncbi:MAG TPA: ABC transporter permease subunit, partial [Ktedonobacteraceae bacterium]|nr:ABC transporter permease subunit [Ktedonobacteraceae bacterium]
MATATISKSIPVPEKRARGLSITLRALANDKVVLSAGVFYAVFVAVIVGILYPSLQQINFNAYMTSNAAAGLLGAKLNNANSFQALMALEMYSSLYALIWGGIVGFIGGAALPATFENGTLDLALARPIPRTRYYLEMWLSAALGGLILSIATAGAVTISSLFVKNANVDWNWLIIAQLIEFAFMFMASGIGALFGSFMNGSRAAGGAAIGTLALFYLMNTLGGLSDTLSWMQKIQPLYYTQSIQALANHIITWWYPLVLVAVGLVCGIAGLLIFNRRDLP